MQPPSPPAEAPEGQERQGRVVVTGVEGLLQVQLTTPQGTLLLVGGLEGEIRNLAGATVSVYGHGPEMGFEVTRYTIVEVNGQKPWVGVVLASGDGFRLDGPDRLRLTGQEDLLRNLVGSKIWVTGTRDGSTLRLGSYGVIRPRGS